MFDVTSKSSFQKVHEWVESVVDNTERTVSMILVGNKIDMKREVSTEEGKKMAESFGIKYFETSAKENIGINESMQEIITLSYSGKKTGEKDPVIIENPTASSTSRCGC